MKKSVLFTAFVAVCAAATAQTRTMSPAVSSKITQVKLNPALLKDRITKYGNTFTNPTVTRNIEGVNVTYKPVKNPGTSDNVTVNSTTLNNSSQTDASKKTFNCTTTRETVTATSTTFMNVNTSGDGIYPGAIYNFADLFQGSMKAVGAGKRNPITIFTDNVANSTGAIAVNVTDPSASTIYTATGPILRNFSTTTNAASSVYQYTYSNNNTSLAISASGGGAYAGFSASAGFKFSKQDNHIYLTYDCRIPLYNLSVEIPTTGFFTDPAIEQTPNLVLMKTVTYGTRILANIDIDESSMEASAFASFQYGKPDVSGVKAAFDFLQKNKSIKYSINTYVVGSAAGLSPHPGSIDELKQQVDAVIRNTTYQTAKPISYILTDMADNSIGVQSATDVYNVTNCVPANSVYTLRNATVKIFTGSNDKVYGSNALFELYTLTNEPGYTPLKGYRIASTTTNTEFKANTDNTFGLSIVSGTGSFLQDFQNGMNRLDVFLDPKMYGMIGDEWDVTGVELTLDFADQNGTPAKKTVKMANANAHLAKNKQRLSCYFGSEFDAKTTIAP